MGLRHPPRARPRRSAGVSRALACLSHDPVQVVEAVGPGREPDYDFRTGESLRDFSARSIAAISGIASRHAGESVLVFTHGGVLDKLYRFVTGLPLSAPRNFGIPNAGLNRIELAANRWQIRAWADVAHLESALDDLPE